jgi:hypothetical protein
MPSYIAESYLSRTRPGELESLATRARDAAQALASEGHDIAYLRSAFVPEDELCLHWFIASSPTLVTDLARLAKLEFDRVIEELERPPHEQPSAHESATAPGGTLDRQ